MSMPGFWEFVTLAVLALLIFGPDKLPGMARTVGRTITQFRREANQALDELKRAAEVDELRKVGQELKETATEIEREASSAAAPRSRPPGGTIAAGDPTDPDAVQAFAGVPLGPPPFDPDAT